jgi:hypothetical protein
MRAPCLMLLTDRTLNDYKLPDGWLPVAAINPAEDGYEAAELDPAMLARFVQLTVLPDPDEWLLWARESEIHPDVVRYIESDRTVFNTPLSNPRSWTDVSDLLLAHSKTNTDRSLLKAVVAGCVGSERAIAFFRFLKEGVEPLRADALLRSYQANRKTIRGWIEQGRLELVKGTLLNLFKHVQAQTDFDSVQKNKTTWKNLTSFLADLPGDLRQQAEEFFQGHDYTVPSSTRKKK